MPLFEDALSGLCQVDDFKSVKTSIVTACRSAGMINFPRTLCNYSQPWFDSDCHIARYNVQQLYSSFLSLPTDESHKKLVDARRLYCNTIKLRKKNL